MFFQSGTPSPTEVDILSHNVPRPSPPLFMYTVSHGKPGNEASLGSNLKWLLRYHVGAHDVTLVELTGLGVRQLVGALDGLVPSPSWWASFRPQV